MSQLTLVTRDGRHVLPVELNQTVVALAKKNKVVWGHACQRGVCAQCRTLVVEGAEYLNEVTNEEKLRLRKAERAEGYRLGCQIQIVREGDVQLAHRPY
ncbi:2Fe-2S iron-sulfur cluster-binding protein [Brevibacillus brevis]|uniref:2Fe-2S iron-sulfur cluster-binding protein n=1 Tax=Brevibacillus brevis TaxID=1393 RepID=A0ABY9TAU4_BREBE|nr:2Fe-2S iron-sulfur cluster-binding protein [Brevibacillus brevis]WNC17244.1 2Fe-2S iron-sulfur cluster-binding protein [Brevibacillus brevis]